MSSLDGHNPRRRPDDVPDDLSEVAQDYADFEDLRGTSSYRGGAEPQRWLWWVVAAVAVAAVVVALALTA